MDMSRINNDEVDAIRENANSNQYVSECEAEDVLRNNVRLVKCYAQIKEELNKSTAVVIADHLYQWECISCDKLEDIRDGQKRKSRRQIVEEVLKIVLMGPNKNYVAFLYALEKNEKHTAESLKAEHVTDANIQRYKAFEEFSLRNGLRPDSTGRRLKFTKREKAVLMQELNDECVIDRINDHLLSMFYTSREEHNDVVNCSFDKKRRLKELIKKITMCPANLKDPFFVLLEKMNKSYLVEKLKIYPTTNPLPKRRKRKRTTEGVKHDASKSAKRLSDDEEEHVVLSIESSPSVIQDYTIDTLGFEVDTVSKGSIVIQMHPTRKDCWSKLEEKCRNGEIKDYIQKLFNIAAAKKTLKVGEYIVQFTIYSLSTGKETQDERICVFHLGGDPKYPKGIVSQSESPIMVHLDLICEELEITDELLTLLKKEKLVHPNIKQELDKQETRAKKNEFLLMQLSSYGAKSYEVLKKYIELNNENLYRTMVAREGEKVIDRSPKERRVRRNRRSLNFYELFFTGRAILTVHKIVAMKKGGLQARDIKVTCPGILDPVIYVSSEET